MRWLIAFLGRDYYVGLITAAAFEGAGYFDAIYRPDHLDMAKDSQNPNRYNYVSFFQMCPSIFHALSGKYMKVIEAIGADQPISEESCHCRVPGVQEQYRLHGK
jgi:hypothetical protein